jgi:hypothetical protein
MDPRQRWKRPAHLQHFAGLLTDGGGLSLDWLVRFRLELHAAAPRVHALAAADQVRCVCHQLVGGG